MGRPVRGGELRVSAHARLLRSLAPAALLALPALLLAAFYAYPLWETLRAAIGEADAWRWLGGPYVERRLVVAFQQALLSVALTLALALPLAWLHHKYALKWSRLHLALHAAPFVLPVFVVVYGVQGVLGPRGLLHQLLGIDALGLLGPMGAVVVAHAYYNYGFAARVLHATLDRRPRRLEDAARVLGASGRGAFWRVSVPLLLPSVLAVALLVFLFTFASFGVVLFLGAGEVSTLETLLYQQLGGAFPRYDRAAALGILQLGINFLLFGAYVLLHRRQTGLERAPDVARETPRTRHRALAWGALALGLLPALTVLAGGFQVSGAWSLEPWRALLDHDHPAHLAGFDLGRAVWLSVSYAAASMTLAIVLTLLLAYGTRALGRRTRALAETLAALPLGTSSLLIGFGYVLAFGAGDFLDLRGSFVVIVLAHTLVAFPFTARVLLPALDLHDRRLDAAAALLGASPWQVVRRVHLPLLAAPLAVAAGLAAAMSLGDFGASLLLMRPDNMALSVWIARHDVPFNHLIKSQAIALAGLLMLLTAGAYLAVERLRPRWEASFA